MKYGSFVLAGCAGIALAVSTASAWAQLPATQLTSVFPPGGKQGATVEFTVAGVDIDDLEKLVFSHPGITGVQKMTAPTELEPTPKPVAGQFTVTIAADVPPGRHEVRAVGRFGLSNARTFVVGATDEILDPGGNTSPDKAIDLPIGSVINGRVDANAYDYLRLTLKQGERVVINLAAQRIDSRLDGTLVLLGPNGRELARVRDTLGADPVLDFTAPAEGAYLLKLQDAVYGGGPEYVYRLSVGAIPFVDFVFPPSGPAGSTNQYTIYGRNLPGGQPADGLMIEGSPLQKLQVAIPLPGDEAAKASLALATLVPLRKAWQDGVEFRLPTPTGPANAVNVYYSRSPNVVVETEPNNEAATAHKITVPCEVVGQFYPQRDIDWVQFEAKKGEVYYIEAISNQLGLDSDPYFALFRVTKNDKGEEQVADVAQVDDDQQRQQQIGLDYDFTSDDPAYKLTVPEDGTYRLMLRDQFGDARKDPSFVYRLAITPAQPDFRVLAYPAPVATQQEQNQTKLSGLSVRKGGTAAIAVAVQRRGDFAGDITISVEGLPAGLTCPTAVIGGGVELATLVITAAEGAASWSGPIKIVARGKIGDVEVAREARYGDVVWGTANRQAQSPQFSLSPTLQLGVLDKDMEPAFVQVGEDKVYETSLGANVEIPITVTRRGDPKEAIKLTAAGLPNEIRPKEVNLDGNTAAGKFELQLNQQNIKPGLYTFYMKGETKRKYVRNPDAIPAAEAEQKAIAEMIVKLTEGQKVAQTAKDVATKTAQDMAAAAKTAEQKKTEAANNAKAKTDAAKAAADALTAAKAAAAADTANTALADAAKAAETVANDAAAAQKKAEEELAAADKALVDAQAAAKTAEDARVASEAALKAATDKLTAANQFKAQLDQRVNQVKQANQPQDKQFAIASTPIKLKIVASPINVTAANPPAAVKQGEKQELIAKLERLYGFAEQIELRFEPPQGVPGISAPQVNVPNGQAEGKLEITTAANAPPGAHVCIVRARGRFNNVQVESTTNVTITVEAKPAQ
jgi:hypothetical protein